MACVCIPVLCLVVEKKNRDWRRWWLPVTGECGGTVHKLGLHGEMEYLHKLVDGIMGVLEV